MRTLAPVAGDRGNQITALSVYCRMPRNLKTRIMELPALGGLLFFFALALPAQVGEPSPQPPWLMELQQILRDLNEAPVGSLDARVETAWRAALQTPQSPEFQTAAQLTTSFYQSQGYDLKAEQVLRQALAVSGVDPAFRRNSESQLASYFENTQQLVKALPIRERLAKELVPPAANGYAPLGYEPIALAHLYERMGEFEKAEAVWKKVAAERAAVNAQRVSGAWTGAVGAVSPSIVLSVEAAAPNELAGFYARRGRTAEAEGSYKEALDAADRSNLLREWNVAADGYVGFLSQQGRFDEAAGLIRQVIARVESSPDLDDTQMLFMRRQNLAGLLTQAGRGDEALAVQRQAVEAARARGSSSFEHIQALGSLAQTLLQLNRFEEAEQAVTRMREAAAAGANNAQFHELMAVQTLAQIRDMQNRPEEARQLRAQVGVPNLAVPGNPGAAGRPVTVFDFVGAAQQEAFGGNMGAALSIAEQAVDLGAERIPNNPEEASALTSLAQVLMSQQQQEAGRRIVVETLRMLEQAPDSPRVADALGSVVPALAQLGMTAEAERALERQERILAGAKGAESVALNAVGYGRIALLQRDSNWAGIIDERKRMLARTEAATGARSMESLNALREVAWAYPPLNYWSEEQHVLSTLLERTVNHSGESSLDHAHLLQQMANRASQNRQFEQALDSMDKAIEITRELPDAGIQLPGVLENRAQIAQEKEAPQSESFHGSAEAPATGLVFGTAVSAQRWFNADRPQKTEGPQSGVTPVAGAVTFPGGLIPSDRWVDVAEPAAVLIPRPPAP